LASATFQLIPELLLFSGICLIGVWSGCLLGQSGPRQHPVHVREWALDAERFGDEVMNEL
jgi:hypothetical protein